MDQDRQEFVVANAVALVEERDMKLLGLRKELARLNKRVRAYRREVNRLEKVIEHMDLLAQVESLKKR